MQIKLAELRFKDYQRFNPPQLKALPINQLPSPELSKFWLNDKRDLNKHLNKLVETFEEEKLYENNSEEPRHMAKMLKKMQLDLYQADDKK